MENFTSQCPTKIIFGKDQLETLGDEILPYGNRVLFVYGENHLKQNGNYEKIATILRKSEIEWVELPGIKPNPRIDMVHRGIELCRDNKVEFILAVGGGSVSDTAKAIAMGVKTDYDIWEAYNFFHANLMHQPQNPPEKILIPNDALPVGVVITKSGTGSEFDLTSVQTNPELKEKLLIMNPVIYPKFAFCDPTLTYSLPKEELAFGIADMMTHYFEQYFSPSHNTVFLDNIKEGILRTIIQNGEKAMENPTDYAIRSELMYAAVYSCSALNITGVIPEWTSHFIEHEISAKNDLNHGCGMAIVYPSWMKYVYKEHPEKFAQYAERVWGIPRNGNLDEEVALEGIKKTQDFWKSLGIPSTLKEVNVDKSWFPEMAKKAVRFGPLGSIKTIEENDALQILNSCQ